MNKSGYSFLNQTITHPIEEKFVNLKDKHAKSKLIDPFAAEYQNKIEKK
jgi:hypothetical protein